MYFSSAAFQPVPESVLENKRKDPLLTRSLIAEALIPPHKIILPSLHVKLGLVTNFIKQLRKTNEVAFGVFDACFPRLSQAKKIAGEAT